MCTKEMELNLVVNWVGFKFFNGMSPRGFINSKGNIHN
jgi:hypothetical protein